MEIDWDRVKRLQQQHLADERIREVQQGQGKPIISGTLGDHTIVGVANTVYWGKGWKTFPDFLSHYLKTKLGPEWGNAEIAKPFAQRHPIIQWYQICCEHQHATIKIPDEVSSAEITGIVMCYLGLAYGLYLLDHNVELQERLIRRLKDPGNFQGAYYEVIVARVLLKAGFTLALEDETDGLTKHCEFSATSKTGKKYWVEAKMRAVAGRLGKTRLDGSSDDKPTKKVVTHLNAALAKPAANERLIFIDQNTEHGLQGDVENPRWMAPLASRLEQYEQREMPPGTRGYLFVTNIAYHLQLTRRPVASVFPYGLGMPDFMKPGTIQLGDAYRRKRAHADAYAILNSFQTDMTFPTTFDGSLPSVAFDGAQRILIGETYRFESGDSSPDVVGTVTSATVDEPRSEMILGITRGTVHSTLRRPMSEAELRDFRAHRDAYFGEVTMSGRTITEPLEMLEWLIEAEAGRTRESFLAHLRQRPDYARYEAMSDDDLRIAHAELMVASMWTKPRPVDNGVHDSGGASSGAG
ncbi:hypothetical protein [Reyranella sp.]|uniref:hypothetical protein n=1 Tax=Reyranella sp. TaxID=1929291 RepID=UPI003C7C4A89